VKRPGGRRWLLRTLQAGGVVTVLGLGFVVVTGCASFGRSAEGPRRARIERSPLWQDGRFNNPEPLNTLWWKTITGAWLTSPHSVPGEPIVTVPGDRTRFVGTPQTGLRVTWFGHSSVLVEIDGHRVLTDPIWSHRPSPFNWIGPERFFPPPVPLDQLPPIDAVVVSHDHYDHLDRATIRALDQGETKFVVPLGLGAHLEGWGVPAARIVELEWWQETKVGNLTIACTPARHASGRMLIDNDKKLWAGFALIGQSHRVYYSGDTGLFPAMREIGARFGPFDLTMIEVGQYNHAWPDWHIGPEQAVRAHQMVRGRVLLPVHWGLFRLAYHGWTEPIERVLVAAARDGVSVMAPRPGQSQEPTAASSLERWWPPLPWQTAADHPIVSTKVD
jgi:L-ascorbate metabolism protein UlaG (beta-lactamase superfamily)